MRLSAEQTRVLLAGIRPHRVKARDGHSYVETYDIRAMLIRVFGYGGWSLVGQPATLLYDEPWELKSKAAGVRVGYHATVQLIIHDPDEVEPAVYIGQSAGEAIMPVYLRGDAHDMAMKTAESGALKRAATNLGDQFGLSLYARGSLRPLVQKVVGIGPVETTEDDTSDDTPLPDETDPTRENPHLFDPQEDRPE